MQQEFITVTFNRTKIAIRCADILYVIMSDDHCRIHMFDGNIYRCRMTLKELKKQLKQIQGKAVFKLERVNSMNEETMLIDLLKYGECKIGNETENSKEEVYLV